MNMNMKRKLNVSLSPCPQRLCDLCYKMNFQVHLKMLWNKLSIQSYGIKPFNIVSKLFSQIPGYDSDERRGNWLHFLHSVFTNGLHTHTGSQIFL